MMNTCRILHEASTAGKFTRSFRLRPPCASGEKRRPFRSRGRWRALRGTV